MRTLTRVALAAAIVLVLLVVATPALLGQVTDLGDLRDRLPDAGKDSKGRQGAAQISSGEFVGVRGGITPNRLRALAGEPEARSRDEVEGVEIECWYYGVVGSTGAYQFCFADGKLSSKLRYGA